MKSTKKQIKHRMKTSKKGLALAASALILSGGPLSVIQAFAEETPQIASPTQAQHNPSKATIQKEATTNTTQEIQIDQSIYGNLLKNPTLNYDNTTNTIPDWQVFLDSKKPIWNQNNTELSLASLTEVGNKVLINGVGGQNLEYTYDTVRFASFTDYIALLSNKINIQQGRTYTASVKVTKSSNQPNYIALRQNGTVREIYRKDFKNYTGNVYIDRKASTDGYFQMEIGVSSNASATYDRNNIKTQLKYADQWKAVDGLFTSLDHSTLAPDVSIIQINQVKKLVTTTPNNADQNEMLEEISKAEKLVTTQSTTQKQNLLNQINNLAPNGQLAGGVTQAQIDQIQQMIDSDKLLSDADKTEVQDALQVVQNLLNKQTEQTTLEQTIKEQLNNFLSGKEQVTDETVKAVQTNINNLTNNDKKQDYQSQLNNIQTAVKAVNDLFNGKQLADGVDDEKIRATNKLVSNISDGTLKTELYKKIDEAQTLLDQVKITNIQTYMQGDTKKITGTYKGKGVKGIRLIVNKEMKPAVGLEDNGTFSYYFPGLKKTDNATIQLLNSKWEVAAEIPVPIERAPLATITEIEPYVQGQSFWIRGEYSGELASYIGLMVGDELKVKVPFDGLAQNKFQYYMDGLTTDQQAQIILYDANNDEIARKAVPVVKPEKIEFTSLKPYTIGKSKFIEGTFTGNTAYYVGLIIDENTVVQAYPSENLAKGVIKYYYPGVSKNQKVQVALYDKQMNRVALSDPITINN